MSSKKVLVPLAQGCEELEAVTIMDLLARAEIEVVSASLDDNKVITASRGTQLLAKTTLNQVLNESFDLIVLPGGLPGADHLNNDLRLQSLLKQTVDNGGLVSAICAAPKVLVSAGLLDGKKATSFPGVIDKVPAKNMTFIDEPVVMDGSVITSRGPGTAIDFTLALIELMEGKEKKELVEKGLVR